MIKMLKDLIKQANGFGASLRLYKPKSEKYEFCITGKDWFGRKIRMGGSAEWLYDELMKAMVKEVKK